MQETWIRCDDIDIAAAFGTIGVPMKVKVQVRADNGREYVTVYLAKESYTRPEIKTAAIMKMLRDGSLEKADPEHPILYALQGIKNRAALGDSVKTSERVILITRKGSHRTAYVKESASGKEMGKVERFLQGGTP